ncbi:uncharacterized protein LOC113351638 [Papaver somniferum]|uniref:uncharacterized protein LOC113351638 n=1 Tax=Papaver somniferum TaxID=3469 RepID=UPI000E6F647A|nr:uncharacterized protein LOC113351638 [Papaver somniferum]
MIEDNNNNRYDSWKFSLIGRLDFLRIKFGDAMAILRNQWKLTGNCQLIPLGKGFFTIKLSNEVDQNYIRNYRWNVEDRVLRTRNWIPNFRPANQRNSHTLVWISLPGLSLEYWEEKTLFTICDAICNPVKVDEATLNYSSGYAAKILVEVNLANTIPNKLWISTKYGSFSQEIVLNNPPKFCSKCKIVGHYLSECIFQKNSSMEHPTEITTESVKNQVEKPQVNNIQEPFDICPPPAVSNSVASPFINEILITSGRFSSLQDDEVVVNENTSGERQEQEMLTPTRILKVVEENSIENSEVKFINGKNGTISSEKILVTSWSRVVQKPPSSTTNSGDKEITINQVTTNQALTSTQLPTKYNFRKNQGKGVVSMSSQMITVDFCGVLISGIHAHVSLVQRRYLWSEMEVISGLNKPWLPIGDYNAIISADEKIGGWSYKVGLRVASDHYPLMGGGAQISKPQNAPMRFQNMWISHPNFMEVFGNINAQVKEAEAKVQEAMINSDNNPFDEAALNTLVESQNLYKSKEVQLNTFLKQKSRNNWIKDGAANTGFLHAQLKIRQARNLITELEDGNGNVEKVDHMLNGIPEVITTEDQNMLDAIPDAEEIKQTLFAMDEDSAPGPVGFSGSFYKACWNVVHEDVVNAIQFFWRRKFIPKGFNSIFLVLIPRTKGARNPKQFRPIGLSNVSFKIFTKILATRMGTLMHKLVSPQQEAYVKGRCIQDQILLSSELVLQKFGFSKSWCDWLLTLFQSAKISVMVNGGPCGFFSEVLIRPTVERKGIHPTHLFFADDVFIFINGAKKSILNLMKLLEDCQKCSGQVIKKSKRKMLIDRTTELRKNQIKDIIQMERSEFPDKYLGVILTTGRVKVSTVWPIVEMMERKLAIWKGKLLSFQERLVLIKSVLCSIPVYNMAVYKWPASVIKICERIMRNFRWSGDGEIRKYNRFSWKRVCTPFSE